MPYQVIVVYIEAMPALVTRRFHMLGRSANACIGNDSYDEKEEKIRISHGTIADYK